MYVCGITLSEALIILSEACQFVNSQWSITLSVSYSSVSLLSVRGYSPCGITLIGAFQFVYSQWSITLSVSYSSVSLLSVRGYSPCGITLIGAFQFVYSQWSITLSEASLSLWHLHNIMHLYITIHINKINYFNAVSLLVKRSLCGRLCSFSVFNATRSGIMPASTNMSGLFSPTPFYSDNPHPTPLLWHGMPYHMTLLVTLI